MALRPLLDLPVDWDLLAAGPEWRLVARELGEERVAEIVPLLREVSPEFRRRFFVALGRSARGAEAEPRRVAVALARAFDDVLREGQ